MVKGSRDREPFGDDLEVIELLPDEATTPRRSEREADDKHRPLRRRGLFLLAIAGVVVAVVGVWVVVSLNDGDAEAEPERRGTSNPSRTVPAVVPGSTVIPPEERPPVTSPGDASTTAPLLPEGAPSTPAIGELVAAVANFPGDGSGGASAAYGAYYLYADGRLIWAPDQAAEGSGFVEQRLTPEGIERVRSKFLAAGLFDPNPPPSSISDCTYGICVRGNDGRLHTGSGSAPMTTQAARLVSYLRMLDESLPETEWAAPRIRTYVASRFNVCVGTYANVPDRAIQVVAPDLSLLLAAFPARAAQILGGRGALRPSEGVFRSPNDPICFEVTLEEARTLADEFLEPSAGGSHEYSGIVIRNPALSAIQSERSEGIVVYINFHALLPHGGLTP